MQKPYAKDQLWPMGKVEGSSLKDRESLTWRQNFSPRGFLLWRVREIVVGSRHGT
jgi:hypothetical protein